MVAAHRHHLRFPTRKVEMSPSYPLPLPAHCCPKSTFSKGILFLESAQLVCPLESFTSFVFKDLHNVNYLGRIFATWRIFFRKWKKKKKKPHTHKHTQAHTHTHTHIFFEGFPRHFSK
jgi:hypothetical protein